MAEDCDIGGELFDAWLRRRTGIQTVERGSSPKPRSCTQCGGPNPGWRCDFCGTVYGTKPPTVADFAAATAQVCDAWEDRGHRQRSALYASMRFAQEAAAEAGKPTWWERLFGITTSTGSM